MPYTLYMLQRVTDAFSAVSPVDAVGVRAFFADVGLADLLALCARRRVERRDHLEVWAAHIGSRPEPRAGKTIRPFWARSRRASRIMRVRTTHGRGNP